MLSARQAYRMKKHQQLKERQQNRTSDIRKRQGSEGTKHGSQGEVATTTNRGRKGETTKHEAKEATPRQFAIDNHEVKLASATGPVVNNTSTIIFADVTSIHSDDNMPSGPSSANLKNEKNTDREATAAATGAGKASVMKGIKSQQGVKLATATGPVVALSNASMEGARSPNSIASQDGANSQRSEGDNDLSAVRQQPMIGAFRFAGDTPLENSICFTSASNPSYVNVPMLRAELTQTPEDVEATAVAVAEEVTEDVKNTSDENDSKKWIHSWPIIVCSLVVLAAAIMIVVVFVSSEDKDNTTNNKEPLDNDEVTQFNDDDEMTQFDDGEMAPFKGSTLEEVKERGILYCGLNNYHAGFSFQNSTSGEVDGFAVDFCKALAKVTLGDAEKFEPKFITASTRFQMLRDRDIDVLTATTTATMGRDIYETTTKFGMTFSVPFYYTGLAFAGPPTMVDCADRLDSFNGPCRNLKICVQRGTTHEHTLNNVFPGPEKVLNTLLDDQVNALESGECNVITEDSIGIPEMLVRTLGYTGPYKIGTKLFSTEPLAIATRDGDPEWSTIVNMVMNVLYTAEALNITQSNVASKNLTGLLGDLMQDDEFASLFVDVISLVGNFGEIYQRHVAPLFPRRGLNTQNDGNGGMVYAPPFGDLEQNGDLPPGGVIESILTRQNLRCGISKRSGFADFDNVGEDADSLWTGLDVEFCVAVAAALFSTHVDVRNHIEFIEVEDTQDRRAALGRGDVDILAGERVTLKSLWPDRENKTKYTFSAPYFFDENGDSIALMTIQQNDTQFSDFVYWVVTSIVYAEENGILRSSLTELPVVNLFGERVKQMFLDTIWEVDNYGILYNRTIESMYPRTGRNMLNSGSSPQMIGYPFL